MSFDNPNNPPPPLSATGPLIQWNTEQILFLKRRIEALTEIINSGGGSEPTLTSTYVGVGDPSNKLTGYPTFIYDGTLGDLQIADPVSGRTAFFVSSLTQLYQLGAVGFGNATYLEINDSTSQLVINGIKTQTQSTKNAAPFTTGFSGIGLNDMQIDTSSGFIGSVSTTYIVTIADDDTTFNWTDGTTSINGVNINTGVPIVLNNGVSIIFTSFLPNTTGDSWTWSYTLSYGRELLFDGQQLIWQYGDIDKVITGLSAYLTYLSSTTWRYIVGDANSFGILADTDSSIYGIGDGINSTSVVGNGTNHTINDGHSVHIFTNAQATPTMQTVEIGGDVTINDGVRGLYYDPPTVVASATITLPSTPVDGQEVILLFGGTIASGSVITLLTISPNNIDQNIVGLTSTTATTQTMLKARYRIDIKTWYLTI